MHVVRKDGQLGFASELKCLLEIPGLDRRIDREALAAYLRLSYVPGPRTIFEGIEKLQPGHVMVADRSGVRTDRYWRLEFPARGTRPASPEAMRQGLRELMRETVREHLLADVPVGVFLSGGIDSSIVVAQMAEFVPNLKTFSIGFREGSYDETRFARAMAQRLGTDHHEMIVEPEHAAEVVRLVSYLDEPFGDLSAVPVYFLSGLARRHVKVALSGDGGDELFGGYLTYVADHLARWYRRIPKGLRDGVIRRLVRRLPTSYEKVSLDYKIKRFVEAADQPALESHLGWKQVFNDDERRGLYRREYHETIPNGDVLRPLRDVFESSADYEFLDRMLHLDINTYLVDDILTKVDRMSMAHSLEVRVPFLDHVFVEYAASIPPEQKLRGFNTKVVLKKTYADLLPSEVRGRRKEGFIFPASLWLQQGLHEFAGDLLSPDAVRRTGIFDPTWVQGLLREHREGTRDRARAIWNLLVFMAWHEHYLDRATAPVPVEVVPPPPVTV
jgi:asparagine synthase (glutamine-hydrolysing)